MQQSGSVLAKDAKFIMSTEYKQRLQKCANSLQDSKLRDLVMYGVGFHYAGMDVSDRKKLKVLLSLETYQCFVTLISKSKEFSDVQLRVKEKRTLNTLNKDKNRITIRIPIDGKIKNEMKVNWEVKTNVISIIFFLMF
ncbi:probable ATP-dependent DNA helicase HFM1 [Acipenser ruthenus]|uniref:probable ATP-dependent DNA helicase HFM1 n=1 Tax=Acipenser ruthenus TaxID=7906 RepID=UPI002741F6C7|nr:probable ATP-dependent DNA helicase HFM1 [Acipenser ruthenus]